MGGAADKVVGTANELAGQARQGVGQPVDNKEMQACQAVEHDEISRCGSLR
jgi:uncharacterized protein YjbJ (UPF0337 family)